MNPDNLPPQLRDFASAILEALQRRKGARVVRVNDGVHLCVEVYLRGGLIVLLELDCGDGANGDMVAEEWATGIWIRVAVHDPHEWINEAIWFGSSKEETRVHASLTPPLDSVKIADETEPDGDFVQRVVIGEWLPALLKAGREVAKNSDS